MFQPGQLIADLLIDSLRTDTNPFDQLPGEKLLNQKLSLLAFLEGRRDSGAAPPGRPDGVPI